MRVRSLLMLSAVAALALSGASARVRYATASGAGADKPERPTLKVVNQGNEQVLQYGDAVVPKPFGAELIDDLAVVGRYQAGGQRMFLVRGDGGINCPSRYVVVVTREGDNPPTVTAPFGTCAIADASQVQAATMVVTMPSNMAGGPPIRFAYVRGEMRPLDPLPMNKVAVDASACRSYHDGGPIKQDALLAEFDRSFPGEFRDRTRLAKMDIAPDQLRRLVTGLACLATWPGAEPMVPQAATPLFASHSYGEQSFAALETVARTPDISPDLVAAVRSFSAEMRYYVARRSAI